MAIRAEEVDDAPGGVDIDRDRRLVVRHQRGDHDAFDELYRRYHARLVSFCVRRVGDRHTAEEIAQDAFVKALRAMPTFAGERRFYPWMTVIAHRLCIDHHRRAGRVEPSAEVDAGVVEADHDALFASVDRDHLAAALDRLAPRHREILALREQRGWSYQAIAEHLGVRITTVEALLHRARKALRREFLAVSDDERGRRLAGAVLGGGLVARLKGWLAALGGPARIGPVLGTAVAGTLALGLVPAPRTDGGDARPVPTGATAASPVLAAGAPGWGSADALARTATATPSTPSTPVGAAATPVGRWAPLPAADLGVLAVYTGAEATDWAAAENREQPVHLALGPVDVGLHPVQLLGDLLDRAGDPVGADGGAP